MRVPANKNLAAYTGNLPVHSLYTVGLAGQAFLQALTDQVSIQGPLFQAPLEVPSGLEVPR